MTEPGWNDYEGLLAEYRSSVFRFSLPLPPGFAFAPEPPRDPRPDMLYQVGVGEVSVLFAWLTGVEEAALRAHRRGDAVEASELVHLAGQFVETDTFKKFNDHDAPVSWYDNVIVPALRGDFSALAADLDFNLGPSGSRDSSFSTKG